MPLYLSESAVDRALDVGDALAAVEAAFARIARGAISEPPRVAAPLDGGRLTGGLTVDRELGLAGLAGAVELGADGFRSILLVFDADAPELIAVLDGARVRALAAGASSAIVASRLARPGARTLGVLGCGAHAAGQVECIRAALPAVERVVVFCRSADRRAAFCSRFGAEPADYGRDVAEQDVVVTATSSRDPVLRGEWLREGALVCAIGATRQEARELDNVVLERAAFVCCDSLDQARQAAGDLIEPVERGVLDWLEVHPLTGVLAEGLAGRQRDEDVVLYKSVGVPAVELAVAALAIERARDRKLGFELPA